MGYLNMPKLRHLAILTRQPEKLADFYKHGVEIKELYRTKNGSVHLSDGGVKQVILRRRSKGPGRLISPRSLASAVSQVPNGRATIRQCP
jgi:hypothetical protein